MAACAANRSPSVGSATSSPSVVAVHNVYQPVLASPVPVPDGWFVSSIQGTSIVSLSPPREPRHGPEFTFEKLATPASSLTKDPCQYAAAPAVQGPTAILGHEYSYQYLCPPRTFLGPEWTVLIPADAGNHTWRITYLGADQLGKGSLSPQFDAVLAGFARNSGPRAP